MKDNGIGIWNITFDVDGKLYVLDEGKIGTSVSNIIKLGNFAISLGKQATVYNMPKDKEEKV